MSKYKVGDVVKVKDNLEINKYYDDVRFGEAMVKYLGKKVTIAEIFDNKYYCIKEDNDCFYWTEDMFEDKIEKIEEISNTYFPEIAKMLGVEINEKFKILDVESGVIFENYYFLNDGLYHIDFNEKKHNTSCLSLYKLLSKQYEIQKLPWAPKAGEICYIVDLTSTYYGWIYQDINYFNILLELGLIVKTKEEAIERFNELLNVLKEKEVK